MRAVKTLIRQVGVALSLGVLPCAHANAQALSAVEQQVVRYIDAHQAEAAALLETVVNIASPTEDVAGVRQVGMVFKGELEALGLRTSWIDMPAEMKRAGHLLAETQGTRGQRLLLLGHIDTVLSGERFRREGQRAYGTGTSDMKGGVVLLLHALQALHAARALADTRIAVMLTGDEENAGLPLDVSRGPMVAAARGSDLVLSFEATVRNTATVARRGSSSWTLDVEAQTGHSGDIFTDRMGSGAIFEAARILHLFYEELHAEKYLTFNPSVIVGGTEAVLGDSSGTATGKSNVVPRTVAVTGDLRFIREEQREAARAKMREIVARNLPGTSAEITFRDGYPAMAPREGNDALLQQLDQVSRDLGFGSVEALDPSERGAGDISFVAHLLPGLDGIGAGPGGNEHAPGEWVDLQSFAMLTKRAAVLIHRLTRAAGGDPS